jgi:hypothetical protein
MELPPAGISADPRRGSENAGREGKAGAEGPEPHQFLLKRVAGSGRCYAHLTMKFEIPKLPY